MPAPLADLRRTARAAFEKRDAAKLERACRAILDASAEDVEARRLLGRAALRDFWPDRAEAWFREAAARAPDNAGVWIELARTLTALRREAEAEAILAAASARGLRSAALLSLLGWLRGALGARDDARAAFELALDVDAGWADAYRGLAATQVLKAGDPRHRQLLRFIDEKRITDAALSSAYYALAEADRAAGDDKGFFENLSQANRLQLSRSGSSESAGGAYRRAARAFTENTIQRAARAPEPPFTPIFVIGAPFSGCSLIEAELARWPGVASCGEIAFLRGPVTRALEAKTGKAAPEGFETLSAEVIAEIASAYNERIAKTAPGAKIIVDAAPDNDRLAGLIPALFPNAKIVRALRAPTAAGFEIFRRPASSPAPYNCDLAAIGERMRRRGKLAEALHRATPGLVLDLSMDELRDRPEESRAKLASHCGLDESAALSGEAHQRASSLLSTGGDGWLADKAWLAYGRELDPLRRALGRARET